MIVLWFVCDIYSNLSKSGMRERLEEIGKSMEKKTEYFSSAQESDRWIIAGLNITWSGDNLKRIEEETRSESRLVQSRLIQSAGDRGAYWRRGIHTSFLTYADNLSLVAHVCYILFRPIQAMACVTRCSESADATSGESIRLFIIAQKYAVYAEL
jgi:hypothetical protein